MNSIMNRYQLKLNTGVSTITGFNKIMNIFSKAIFSYYAIFIIKSNKSEIFEISILFLWPRYKISESILEKRKYIHSSLTKERMHTSLNTVSD